METSGISESERSNFDISYRARLALDPLLIASPVFMLKLNETFRHVEYRNRTSIACDFSLSISNRTRFRYPSY